MDERRKQIRVETSLRVEVRAVSTRIFGQVRNLTLEGAGIALPTAVPRGEAELELALVDEEGATQEALQLSATIIWTAEVAIGRWAVGVRFEHVNPEQQAQLSRFLAFT